MNICLHRKTDGQTDGQPRQHSHPRPHPLHTPTTFSQVLQQPASVAEKVRDQATLEVSKTREDGKMRGEVEEGCSVFFREEKTHGGGQVDYDDDLEVLGVQREGERWAGGIGREGGKGKGSGERENDGGEGGQKGSEEKGEGKSKGEEDKEIEIVGMEGQFSLVDYAHSRDTCVSFALGTEQACANCWCFVCEVPWRQCESWGSHHLACWAEGSWRTERDNLRNKKKNLELCAKLGSGGGGGGGEGAAGLAAGLAVEAEMLHEKQQEVVNLCLAGENVFFTGMGGTGKSLTLKRLVDLLRKKHGADSVVICAPTGVAAINVGGQTLHRYSVYLLFWYTSTNTDAAQAPQLCRLWSAHERSGFQEMPWARERLEARQGACARRGQHA